MHTMQLMVEQERRNVEQLRQDLAGSYSTKTQQELDMAVKRLAKLESQLSDFKKVQNFLQHHYFLPKAFQFRVILFITLTHKVRVIFHVLVTVLH